ncbi:MAG: alpha/beta fold hydrolase [Thermoleophilia bacterium]|nr:alpha/beta fold hydrolase [Thermoleophilia bacterium]
MSLRIGWEERGEGSPLVLVQGLGYARWGWEPVADLLAERFRVILFDNRGIGESETPPGPYTVQEMARDVVQVLDEAGICRAHLVATSLGGMIGQELALAVPERVERLVLVCTTPGGPNAIPMPEPTVRLIAEGPTLAPLVALRRFVENALATGAPDELVERILAHRIRTAQPLEAWLAQAAAGAAFDAWDRLPGLELRTLVLHGTADVVVDPRNADLLVARIPDAELELFPGCGHLLYWERPEAFVARVGEFLA